MFTSLKCLKIHSRKTFISLTQCQARICLRKQLISRLISAAAEPLGQVNYLRSDQQQKTLCFFSLSLRLSLLQQQSVSVVFQCAVCRRQQMREREALQVLLAPSGLPKNRRRLLRLRTSEERCCVCACASGSIDYFNPLRPLICTRLLFFALRSLSL